MIHIYNVTKVYPTGAKALTDVTLNIGKGEFVFLVGASGAGKSSLLKLIFREEIPTRGQILFGGRNMARMRRWEVPHHRRSIGFVFQDFRLLSDRTVAENLAFALQVTGSSKKVIRAKVPQVLAQVGLANKGGYYPRQLSGGEQQRVSIARAIINNPKVVIADEPTGNLDPVTAQEIMHIFEEINQNGTTIIMATHARIIVDSMQKRVVALENGRVVRDEEKGNYSDGRELRWVLTS